jgi:hypothetical protein
MGDEKKGRWENKKRKKTTKEKQNKQGNGKTYQWKHIQLEMEKEFEDGK